MALVRHITRVEEIPHEPGQSFTFRALNWVQRQEAKEVKSKAQLQGLRELGADLIQLMQTVRGDAVDTAAVLADPFATYDQATLLHAGIVGWSYEEPVSAETIADLDEPTAVWAARRILALSGIEEDPTTSSSGSTGS